MIGRSITGYKCGYVQIDKRDSWSTGPDQVSDGYFGQWGVYADTIDDAQRHRYWMPI